MKRDHTLPKRAAALFLAVVTFALCLPFAAFASGKTLHVMEAFRDEHVGGEYVEGGELLADGYERSMPCEINTYVRETPKDVSRTRTFPDGKTRGVIFYVIGTNTERIGTDSDEEIIDDLLEDGWLVVVADYDGNPDAVSPRLDWDVQGLRYAAYRDGSYLYGQTHAEKVFYVLPAGYRIRYNIPYFNMETQGAVGCVAYTVDVWNSEKFRSTYGETLIYWRDAAGERKSTVNDTPADAWCDADGKNASDGSYLKLKYTKAVKETDPVKPDGTAPDYTLFLDILYPSNPAGEVPVYFYASYSYTRAWAWTSHLYPHLSGFLFRGYAGVIYDPAVNPLCREDHYGYFDSPMHSLISFTGLKSQTAAVRCVRYLANLERDRYAFDLEKFGVMGHSKSGYCYQLGNPEISPDGEEQAAFAGHHGETAEGVVQPFLTYEGGARDGQPIRSNVQMVYGSSAAGAEYVCKENFAPTFLSSGEKDFNHTVFYIRAINQSRYYGIPMLNVSMPGVGHNMVYGYHAGLGVDMYEMLFDLADSVLLGKGAVLETVTPKNGATDVPAAGCEINLRFSGAVSRAEIESKVKIVNTYTGECVTGEWTEEFGRCSWTFCAQDLRGGYAYAVLVPSNLLSENGQPIKEGKRSVFTVKSELTVGTASVASDASGVLTKSADGEASGVFLAFPEITEETNTTHTALRFSVTNDAANRVGVYAVTSYDAAHPGDSVIGERLGVVTVIGAGTYELDISSYFESLPVGTTPVFLLRAEKTVGQTVITEKNFDTATGANVVSDHVSAGKCFRSDSDYLSSNALFPSGIIGAEDFGRRFRIRFDVLTEENRVIYGNIRDESSDSLYYNDYRDSSFYTSPSPKNVWQTIEFFYDVKDADYYRSDIQKKNLYIAKSGRTEGGVESIFLDNLFVTEEVTEVAIASALTACGGAPALVYHPANYVTPALTDGGMIGSGEDADTVFTGGETLTVSGRIDGQGSERFSKVYAKLDLSSYDASRPAEVRLVTSGTARGDVYVFGLSDVLEASDWSAETLNFLNAAGNDRFGFGVDLSHMYENSYLARLHVTGAGTYAADVGDYASYMKEKGAAFGTLVLVNATRNGERLTYENYEEQVLTLPTVKVGDTTASGERSAEEDYPAGKGYSFKFTARRKNDFIRVGLFDASYFRTSDAGRSLRASFAFKASEAISLRVDLRHEGSATEYDKQVHLPYTSPGEWQTFDIEFSLSSEMIGKKIFLWIAMHHASFTYAVQDGVSFVGYIDEVSVTDCSGGEISFTFADGKGSDGILTRADFENKSTIVNKGGLSPVNTEADTATAGNGTYIRIGLTEEENHTPGGTRALVYVPNTQETAGSSNWGFVRFYNLFPRLFTASDEGRTFRLTYYVKSPETGLYYAGFLATAGSEYTASNDPSDPTKTNTCLKRTTVSLTTPNEWTKVTFDFTVTSEFWLDKSGDPYTEEKYVPMTFAVCPQSAYCMGQNVPLYFDDFTLTELGADVPTRDETRVGFESTEKVGWAGSRVSQLHESYAQTINEFHFDGVPTVSLSEENHTAGGGKSLFVRSDETCNALYFFNMIKPKGGSATLTAADIGRSFTFSFFAKASKTGTFSLFLGDLKYTNGAYAAYSPREECAVLRAGEWTKFSFDFTVTAEMIAAVEGGVEGINPVLQLTGFGQQKGKEAYAVDLFFDDLLCIEHVEGAASVLPVCEAATVSNTKREDTALAVGRGEVGAERAEGIRKVYFAYAASDTARAERVILTLNVLRAGRILLYGVTDGTFPDTLTWNTAPATLGDEEMDEKSVFGGAPLAVITESGEIRIDVTEYVRAMDGKRPVFAFTTEEAGGIILYRLDFSSIPLFVERDYTSDGDVTLSEGRAETTGRTITFENLIGGLSPEEGKTYRLRAKVDAPSDTTVTLTLDGTGASVSRVGGGTLALTYVATAEDILRGFSCATITAQTAGFAVEELEFSSDTSAAVAATPILSVGVAEEVTFDEKALRVKSNITLYTDFLYHAYVPVISALTSLTLDGETLDLANLPTKVIDGTLYYVVTKPIAPKDGTKAFTLKATVLADGKTKTATYNLSIPTYAAKIVGNGTYDAVTQTLMKDILSYIESATVYFNTKSESTEAAIRKVIDAAYNSTLTAEEVGLTEENKVATDSGKALSTVCLNLDAKPSFIFYLEAGKEALADTFKFESASGAPLTVTAKKETSGQKRTYLEVTTYAYAMGDTLSFTYTDENEVLQKGTYHLAAYYGGETSDANLSTLLLRLAKYARSAKAYRDSVLNPEGN